MNIYINNGSTMNELIRDMYCVTSLKKNQDIII
jgi:hypothetical protein